MTIQEIKQHLGIIGMMHFSKALTEDGTPLITTNSDGSIIEWAKYWCETKRIQVEIPISLIEFATTSEKLALTEPVAKQDKNGVYTHYELYECQRKKIAEGNAGILIRSSTFIEYENSHSWALYDDNTLVISGNGELPHHNNEEYWTGDRTVDYTPWASYQEVITSIVIQNGITGIAAKQYCQCKYEDNLWDNCCNRFHKYENLKTISFPESALNIHRGSYGKSLCSIEVDSRNPNYSSENGVLFNKQKTKLLVYPKGKTDTKYIIPESVETITYYAFSGCCNLNSIEIPESVQSIGRYAFSGCDKIKSICIPKNVKSIWEDAFDKCSSLTSIVVDEKHNTYFSLDGVLMVRWIEERGVSLCRYPEGKKEPHYIIPDIVNEIDGGAFRNCSELVSIIIPSSVFYIRNELDVNVEQPFFYGCSKLESIYVDSGNPEYSSENGVLFDKLKTVLLRYPEGKRDTHYIIPPTVIDIGVDAFSGGCNLTSLTIGENVKNIAIDFKDCNNLKLIHSKAKNPPKEWFGNSIDWFYYNNTCTLSVPVGCKDKYVNQQSYWGLFKSIREDSDSSEVTETYIL